MKKLTFILLAISSLNSSCISNIQFEVEPLPTKLVLNGILETDSVFKIHVSSNIPPTGNTEPRVVENAEVLIQSSTGETFQLELVDYDGIWTQSAMLKFYKSGESFRPTAGSTYSIEVNANGFQTISASFKMPKMPEISNVKFASTSFVEMESNSETWSEPGYFLPVKLTINDEPDKNYYELTMYTEQKAQDFVDMNGNHIVSPAYLYPIRVFSYNQYLNSSKLADWADNITTGITDSNSDGTLLFDDSFFDGEDLKIELLALTAPRAYGLDGTLSMSIRDTDLLRYHVQLRNVSKEYYLYKQTLIEYVKNSDNEFVEPINVYSNINDGLGIFAGESVQTFILEPTDPSHY